jgi:hypothetical protein
VGADAFYVCYGIRRDVRKDDEATVKLLELRRHPCQLAAKQHDLVSWWGETIDEHAYFVLIGKVVRPFGWEGEAAGQYSNAEATALMSETAERLRAAGFEDTPAWHFQFEPDR